MIMVAVFAFTHVKGWATEAWDHFFPPPALPHLGPLKIYNNPLLDEKSLPLLQQGLLSPTTQPVLSGDALLSLEADGGNVSAMLQLAADYEKQAKGSLSILDQITDAKQAEKWYQAASNAKGVDLSDLLTADAGSQRVREEFPFVFSNSAAKP